MLAIRKTATVETDRMQGSRAVSLMLIIIGFCAMGVVMFMSARFGYSLQDDPADRYASAIIHILVDAGAASLITASGIMLSWGGLRWRSMGIVAFICALALVAYSVITVYGFMSTRIAHLESHNQLVAMQTKQLDWTRSTSVNRDVPRAERLFLRQEAKSARDDLKKSLAIVPDAAAASIASVFNTSVERVQRALVMIGSCIGQLIKISCLFIGFSLWPHRLQSGGNRPGGGGNQQKEPATKNQEPTKLKVVENSVPQVAARATTQRSASNVIDIHAPKASVPLSLEDRVLSYVTEQIARRGSVPSQLTVGRAFALTKPQTSKLISRLERAGKVARRRNGKSKEIVRPAEIGGSKYASACI